MKKLSKKLLAFLMCIAMCLGMCACGGKEEEETDEYAEGETVELSLWWTSGALSQAYLETMIDKFNESQDDYWIVVYNNGTESAIRTKLETTKDKANYPDLFIGEATATCYFDGVEYVKPIQEFIDADSEDISEGMYDSVKRTYTNMDGEFIGFPCGVSCAGYYVNVDAVEQAGYKLEDLTSFEKIAEVTTAIVNKGICKYGVSTNTKGIELVDMLTLQGVDYVDADNGYSGDISKNLLLKGDTKEAYQKAATLYAELRKSDVMMKYGTDVSSECWPLFNSGDLAMLYCTNSWTHYVVDGNPSFNYAFIPSVGVDDNAKYQNAAIPEGSGLYIANTENERKMQGAYEFIKFMSQAENQSQYCSLLGYIPYTDEAFNQPDYQEWMNKYLPSLVNVTNLIKTSPEELRIPYVPVFDEMKSVTTTLFSYLSEEPDGDVAYYMEYASEKLDEGIEMWLDRQ